MAKALKTMMVAEYERELDGESGLVLVDPGPMSVQHALEFRRDLRQKAGGARMRVIHNRTARRALERTFYGECPEVLDALLRGPTAMIFGGEGPISIAKVLREWRRRFRDLRFKGGVADGEVLDAQGVEGLADIPGVPQLRAMLLSAVVGPARGIAGALNAAYAGIARALQARIDSQEQERESNQEEEEGESGG